MSTFLLDSGRLAPATREGIIPDGFNAGWCDLVRQDVLDLVGLDAFAVAWDQGTPPLLTAMRATGAVVGAAVLPRLDLVTLAELLARAGQAHTQPWHVTAGRYGAGIAAFRRDWNAFREARSFPPARLPVLVVVTGAISAQVRQALPLLEGVHLVRAQVRHDDRGRDLLDLETVTVTGAGRSGSGASEAAGDGHVAPSVNRATATSNGAAISPANGAVTASASSTATSPPNGTAAHSANGTAAHSANSTATAHAAGPPTPLALRADGDRAQGTTSPAPAGSRRAHRDERDVPTAITVPTPQDVGARPGAVIAEDVPTTTDMPSRHAAPLRPDAPSGPDSRAPVDTTRQQVCPDLHRVAVLVRAPVQIELECGKTRRQATLRRDGRVALADGTVHTDLAHASMHLAGAEPADPWQAWRFSDANLPLADARAEAQRHLTTRAGAGSPDTPVPGRRARL
ncbi:hypothetical protein [Pseudactinotalea sp. Z1748]|uniref:hypothetical protein n=1 Tax=Pseudactinotalea sp. Z1748 TaxID=3413027 RepID=UPI003C7B0D27